MFAAQIGSDSEHLRLALEEGRSGAEHLLAALRLDGMTATASVYGYEFHDLAEFFAGLEASWRGWPGTREWQSLEGDLILKASHDGHVVLTVEMVRAGYRGNETWRVSAVLTLDPGEQLSQIATDVGVVVRAEA